MATALRLSGRLGLLVVLAGLFAVLGCGGGSEPQSFPRGHINVAGNYYVPVADGEQAQSLCNAMDDWPAEYPDRVTFDIPNTGHDRTCIRG